MKVLVTGGGGFLGQNLVRRLKARGDEPRVLGRSHYPHIEALGVPQTRGDVRDEAAVRAAVEGADAVFHVAARVGYWGRYSEYRDVNVTGTETLLAAARAAGVGRFVYTSTPSVVIGPKGDLKGADETAPYPERYLSHYGPTKAEAERAVLAASDEAMRTAALRPHFIYGPGDPQIAPRLVERSKQGAIAQVGDGQNMVDVAYIDNVVDAHMNALDTLADPAAEAAGEAFFIGDPEPIRLWAFVGRVLDGLGAPPVNKRISFRTAWTVGAALEGLFRLLPPSKEPPMTRMAAVILGTSHYFSHAKAATLIGYRPAVGTDVGLERLFQHERTRPPPP